MNNLFFAQLKKELFVAITERESVTGKCETLNNLLCEKIAAELSEKYYDLKIYHSEFGLCRSFWNAKYEWIEQEDSIGQNLPLLNQISWALRIPLPS